MIPSDHFVRFYNEVFKFFDLCGELHVKNYYKFISEEQERYCSRLWAEKKLMGMYEYWERIRIEENCDMIHSVEDGCYMFKFNGCPSLKKICDNDASAFPMYCDHCPGWILPIMSKGGFYVVYDLINRMKPQCQMFVFLDRKRAEEKQTELISIHGSDVVISNLRMLK
jgi:hypothetical protein